MYAQDLGYENYESYRRSPHWLTLKPKKDQICQRRSCGNRGYIPHHLHYKTLGRERRRDYVYLCTYCNHLAHFYDTEEKVEVEKNGDALLRRWKEINSLWWNLKQYRPSDLFDWLYESYRIV